MKVEFSIEDMEYIHKLQTARQTGENIPVFLYEDGMKAHFEFEVTDFARANLFALYMMSPSGMGSEFQKEIGIDVKNISYSTGDRKKEELIEYLENFIKILKGE